MGWQTLIELGLFAEAKQVGAQSPSLCSIIGSLLSRSLGSFAAETSAHFQTFPPIHILFTPRAGQSRSPGLESSGTRAGQGARKVTSPAYLVEPQCWQAGWLAGLLSAAALKCRPHPLNWPSRYNQSNEGNSAVTVLLVVQNCLRLDSPSLI